MLADKNVMATVAVRNLETAKKFYGETLGLKLTPKQQRGTLAYQCGSAILLVYESRYAGTNQATAATWTAGEDVEDIVKTLRSRGVVFEHYDLPVLTRLGDLHVAGDFKTAWFKDPDGNILSIVSG